MSSSATLSPSNRAMTERTPHELLPIMPPSVQRSCVDGIGPEREAVLLGRVAEMVEHDAGLRRARAAAPGSISTIAVQVLREVEHDRDVAALAGEARAAAARQDRRAVLAADRHGGDEVVDRRAG